MKRINLLINEIVSAVNIHLRHHNTNLKHSIDNMMDEFDLIGLSGSYESDTETPLNLCIMNSNVAGSFFLGNCVVDKSIVYKSDIRGDELKKKGDAFGPDGEYCLRKDETISVQKSLLSHSLIHSTANNPETPEKFTVKNSVAFNYSIINGGTIYGSWIGFFATVDDSILYSCITGDFSFIKGVNYFKQQFEDGTIIIQDKEFSFHYQFEKELLKQYINSADSENAEGRLIDFNRKIDAISCRVPSVINGREAITAEQTAVNPFAVIDNKCEIHSNVTISQNVYIEASNIGAASVLREKSVVLHSKLMGYNLINHGSKIIHSDIGLFVNAGINCFINGKEDAAITIGEGSVILPNTIIDPDSPLDIPRHTIVWGMIRNQEDFETHSFSINHLKSMFSGRYADLSLGNMTFTGDVEAFLNIFYQETDSILSKNGAFKKEKAKEDIQSFDNSTVHILQPYRFDNDAGIYPTIRIKHQ